MLLFYYQQISKAGSNGSDVDTFYLNFLKEIFLLRDNFGAEQESRVLTDLGISQRADFTIRCIKNGDPKKVILCENKKRDYETQNAVWKEALKQAVNYASLIRSEEYQNPDETLYLAVNIGKSLRFYELPGRSIDPLVWTPAES